MDLKFTHEYAEAVALRDAGYEPIECAFGQYGSVLGRYDMDHHGTESHREGVAIRACRDVYGALAADPRFVVTGTPDADAVLAIVALSARVPRDLLRPAFYKMVDRYDTDPIGVDLLATEVGLQLAWFNQREGLGQTEAGFHRAIASMVELLEAGLDEPKRVKVRKSHRARRRRAMTGVAALYDASGLSLPVPEDAAERPVRRGAAALDEAAVAAVTHSTVWGFDMWYRLAPLVVSFASRIGKVTVGCPDEGTAELLFGPGGLQAVWPRLGQGWGGRSAVGGSPRGGGLTLADAHQTALSLLAMRR